MIGRLVVSKAGHDKEKRYIVLREDEKYVYISDGRLHMIEKPKKKNKKHMTCLMCDSEELSEIRQNLSNGNRITNEMLKRAIKLSMRL